MGFFVPGKLNKFCLISDGGSYEVISQSERQTANSRLIAVFFAEMPETVR